MIESLTYAQLAERLGCNPEAARAVAKRKRWTRQIGNDGKARVMADLSELSRPASVRPASALLAQLEALQAELAAVRAELVKVEGTAAERRADYERERDRGDRLASDLSAIAARMARPWFWWRRSAA